MSEKLETLPNYADTGVASEQYGLACNLDPRQDYATQPFDIAFNNTDVLIPYFASMTPSQLNTYDITAFYSRRLPGLSVEETASLEDHDRRAFEAALGLENPALVGKMDSYFRGENIDTSDRGIGPYGMDFTPTCMSCCFWQHEDFANLSAQSPHHHEAMKNLTRWMSAFAIVKLSPVLSENPEGSGPQLNFAIHDLRVWHINHQTEQ